MLLDEIIQLSTSVCILVTLKVEKKKSEIKKKNLLNFCFQDFSLLQENHL